MTAKAANLTAKAITPMPKAAASIHPLAPEMPAATARSRLTRRMTAAAPHPARGWAQQFSAEISSLAGHPRQHLLFYAFLLALVLAPLARGDALRAMAFALIALVVAWIQMAIAANAGGSVHHAILLWPLPQLVVAVSFA